MDQQFNPSIGCSVSACRYHCTDKQYCSLDKINISDTKNQAKKCRDTLCSTFECSTEDH